MGHSQSKRHRLVKTQADECTSGWSFVHHVFGPVQQRWGRGVETRGVLRRTFSCYTQILRILRSTIGLFTPDAASCKSRRFHPFTLVFVPSEIAATGITAAA